MLPDPLDERVAGWREMLSPDPASLASSFMDFERFARGGECFGATAMVPVWLTGHDHWLVLGSAV